MSSSGQLRNGTLHVLERNEKIAPTTALPPKLFRSFIYLLFLPFFFFLPLSLPTQRLINEKSVENDNVVIQEKEVHIEEFQRVSISGEEKCGVSRLFLRGLFIPPPNMVN